MDDVLHPSRRENRHGGEGAPCHWTEAVVQDESRNQSRSRTTVPGLQSGTWRSREAAGRGSPLRGCGYRSAAVSAETRSWVLGVSARARNTLGELPKGNTVKLPGARIDGVRRRTRSSVKNYLNCDIVRYTHVRRAQRVERRALHTRLGRDAAPRNPVCLWGSDGDFRLQSQPKAAPARPRPSGDSRSVRCRRASPGECRGKCRATTRKSAFVSQRTR